MLDGAFFFALVVPFLLLVLLLFVVLLFVEEDFVPVEVVFFAGLVVLVIKSGGIPSIRIAISATSTAGYLEVFFNRRLTCIVPISESQAKSVVCRT